MRCTHVFLTSFAHVCSAGATQGGHKRHKHSQAFKQHTETWRKRKQTYQHGKTYDKSKHMLIHSCTCTTRSHMRMTHPLPQPTHTTYAYMHMHPRTCIPLTCRHTHCVRVYEEPDSTHSYISHALLQELDSHLTRTLSQDLASTHSYTSHAL
jgi:hypothetical protein